MPNNTLIPYSSSPNTRFQNGAFLEINNASLANLLTDTNAYTVEAWVKFNATDTEQCIFYAGPNSTTPYLSIGLNEDGNVIATRVNASLTSQTTLEFGEWYFIAITYNMGMFSLYVNSALEDSQVSATTIESSQNSYISIAAGYGIPPSKTCDCFMQVVGIWSDARNNDELIQDMGATPSPQTNLEAWFDFGQNPAIDVSGNNHTYSLNGTPLFYLEIPCLKLDGSNYADCSDSESLDFSGAKPYTLEAMGYFNEINGMPLVCRYKSGNQGQYDLGMGSPSGHGVGSSTTNYFDVYYQQANWWLFSNTAPQPNEWYHIAGTFDGSTLSIYVNGILENSVPWAGPNPETAVGTLIGAYFGSDGTVVPGLNGNFAYVRIWNVCRSASEIQDFMNKNPLDETGLVANYDFSSMPPVTNDDDKPLPNHYKDVTLTNTLTLKNDAVLSTILIPLENITIPSAPNIDTVVVYESPELGTEDIENLHASITSIELPPLEIPKEELFGEIHYQSFVKTYEAILPNDAINREQVLTAYKDKVKTAFDQAKNDPEGFKMTRPVFTKQEGTKYSIMFREGDGYVPILELDSRDSSSNAIQIVALTIELVITIVLGVLNVFGLGLAANAATKLTTWLATQPALCNAVVKIMLGVTVTAATVWTCVKMLLNKGYLKTIALMVCSLSFWVFLRVFANLVLWVLAPEAKIPQILASLAITTVHVISISYQLYEAIEDSE